MRKPDFLVLGAAKSGTTALHYYLNQHPQIYMSHIKETHWLDYRWHKGGFEEYRRRFFSEVPSDTLCGESTPSYLMLPFVADRIRYYMPDIKMIAVLRDPVERAFSSWWMLWSRGHEHLKFRDAIFSNFQQYPFYFKGNAGEQLWQQVLSGIYQRQMQYRVYLEEGEYSKHLKEYLLRFHREQIYVLFADDLMDRPREVMENLFDWLNLDRTKVIDTETQNQSLAGLAVPVMKLMGKTGLKQAVARVPESWRRKTKKWLSYTGRRPDIDLDVTQDLIDYYRPEIDELSRLLEKDIWYARYTRQASNNSCQ